MTGILSVFATAILIFLVEEAYPPVRWRPFSGSSVTQYCALSSLFSYSVRWWVLCLSRI